MAEFSVHEKREENCRKFRENKFFLRSHFVRLAFRRVYCGWIIRNTLPTSSNRLHFIAIASFHPLILFQSLRISILTDISLCKFLFNISSTILNPSSICIRIKQAIICNSTYLYLLFLS